MPDLQPEPSGAMILWRAYVPRWAHAPLSGEGAARFGGRWNPTGAETIYAACELSTAWAEYNQGFVQHPALIAQLMLTDARLADLATPAGLSALGVTQLIHQCEWRSDLDAGRVPETHVLREKLLAQGFHGVIYPSYMSLGGVCVALWLWNRPDCPSLAIVDPDGRMPKSAASWI